MRLSDIPAVSAIERLSFPQPWPQSAYRREIVENRMAYYVVARQEHEDLELAAPPSSPLLTQPIALPSLPGEEGLLGRLQRLFRAQDDSTASNGDRSVVGYAGLWLMS